MEHGRHFDEKEMLRIFRGVCYAVRALHTHKFPSAPLRSEDEESNPINSFIQNDDDIVPFAHRDIKPG